MELLKQIGDKGHQVDSPLQNPNVAVVSLLKRGDEVQMIVRGKPAPRIYKVQSIRSTQALEGNHVGFMATLEGNSQEVDVSWLRKI